MVNLKSFCNTFLYALINSCAYKYANFSDPLWVPATGLLTQSM